jgi:hypothetical protein
MNSENYVTNSEIYVTNSENYVTHSEKFPLSHWRPYMPQQLV